MKTTFYIIVTFFGLQSNLLFASGTEAQNVYSMLNPLAYEMTEASNESPAISEAELRSLAPVNPTEADFSDNDLAPLRTVSVNEPLAPQNPAEADFSDSEASSLEILFPGLSPVIPSEADFQDSDNLRIQESKALAPATPTEAGFDDIV